VWSLLRSIDLYKCCLIDLSTDRHKRKKERKKEQENERKKQSKESNEWKLMSRAFCKKSGDEV
jgi:hypothetical protein